MACDQAATMAAVEAGGTAGVLRALTKAVLGKYHAGIREKR